jgi:hypothetical protein
MWEMNSCHNRARAKQAAAGFTVTELMVAVSLMTLIVVALYQMFNQTQKAMRANEAQVDSTERGRGVLELVSRELESARVGMRADATNLWLRSALGLTNLAQNDFQVGNVASATSLRSNLFDDIYYLTKTDKAWRGMGYVVMQAQTNSKGFNVVGRPLTGLGTLYRYETPLTNRDYAFPSRRLYSNYVALLPKISVTPDALPAETNFSQIAQGIVHFKVLPFDTKGQLLAYGTTNLDSSYMMLRKGLNGILGYPASNIDRKDTNLISAANVILESINIKDLMDTMATFRSNALPAYLELELGVLEPDALRIYNQMLKDEQYTQARAYLEKRIAKVQIFRKRIPLRTVAQ